ncbi:hypothetical protein ABT158_48645 [Nonomuraea sp. NPDC001636]|uniref:hypothetical protein n=1 Tax=Nonomuraea sp. NPDC001636 TaxID=3154391 RepID=UPI00332D5711
MIRLAAFLVVIAAMLASSWYVFQVDQGLGVLILAIGVLIITPAFYKIIDSGQADPLEKKDDSE